MANILLTPISLWRDFDDSLPFEEEILSDERIGGFAFQDVAISGRKTAKGRVRIHMHFAFPEGKERFPAVMVLFEAMHAFDMRLVNWLLEKGYGVLCVDYCGEKAGRHTVYPSDIDYANYTRAGTHIDHAEPTARETSWYEWAGVARYAARWLAEHPNVSAAGAIGIRTGGEILFKIAPYAPISCMISVCAAGWLAYRGMEKFGEGGGSGFNDERHRFIAGIDSQSYAPHVKCPVLLLSAINDPKYNYDRVYDTFRQINPAVEKALLFSSHGNGLIGSHSLKDLELFLSKYLQGRSVYISDPINIAVTEDEEGNLAIKGTFDRNGEIEQYGIFFTERATGSPVRDWSRILGKDEDLAENVGVIPLSLYEGSERALVYAFVNYSNTFSVTSKIMEIPLKKRYRNMRPHSRVIYTNADGLNGFSVYRRKENVIADCFMKNASSALRLLPGYGGIHGIAASAEIISYRVSEPRYLPPAAASFCFDAWSATDGKIKVVFYKDAQESVGYSCEARVAGSGKWKNILLDASSFKSETGEMLHDFTGVVSVVFASEGEILINNVLWI